MTGLRRYAAYKDSGFEWLGRIPDHWIVNRTSRLFKVAMGQTILKEDLSTSGGWPVFSATEGDHYFGRIDNPQVRLQPGDLVIPARGNSIGNVKLVQEPATSTQTTIFCQRIEPSPLSPEFSFYYMSGSRKYLFDFTQTAIPQITVAEVGQNPIVVPPMAEQSKIARFLDRETAQIDDLIGKQERLIELLVEKRQAIITHAVTKGLDVTAPMRASKTQWLDGAPAHWFKVKLGWAFSFLNGDRGSNYPSRDDFQADGVPFINAGHLSGDGIDMNSMNFISSEKYEELGGAKLRAGDVLYCLRGSLGKHALLADLAEGALASSLVALRPRRPALVSPAYLTLLLKSPAAETQLTIIASGSAQPNMSVENLRSFSFSVPPLEEQRMILQHVNKECDRLNRIESTARAMIRKLQERRSALVSAAVTGKINVTNEGVAA